jgi:WD repeat-containing protein 7
MSFVVPLTFPATSFLRTDEKERCETTRILERSLIKSHPTILKHLGPRAVQDETHVLVLGCRDGTLYVFHRLSTPSPDVIGLVPGVENNKSLKPRIFPRISKNSNSSSPPVSPTSLSSVLSPTFNVTAKLRVVSGVTTEQVEAPKNHVDFEDEPDKLKDILKGRNPRERHDSNSDRAHKSAASSIIEPAPKRKNPVPKSLSLVGNSPTTTPPFSAPSSPRECGSISPLGPSYHWDLLYHAIPSRSGFEHSVKSIQFLDDGRFFVVLQKTGYVGLLTKSDFLTPVIVIYTFSCLKMALVWSPFVLETNFSILHLARRTSRNRVIHGNGATC